MNGTQTSGEDGVTARTSDVSPGSVETRRPEASPRRRAMAITAGAVIDWYDFFLYGTAAAVVFGAQFFHSGDPLASLMASMGSFAVAFIFRPVGGAIFGHFGDRIGRRQCLFLTVIIMGVASAAIGLLPTYAQIGVAAPICLVLLRAVQGIAVGGEWGGAALMAVESAPEGRKNFLASGVQVGSFLGLLLGTGLFTLMQAVTTQDQFLSWGWRVPFLLSIVFAAIGLVIRAGVAEADEFVEMKQKHQESTSPLKEAVRTAPLRILAVIGMRLVDQGTFYLAFTFALAYVSNYTDVPTSNVLIATMVALVLACILTPMYGKLADRIGIRVFYLVGPLCAIAAAVPFFLALHSGSLAWTILAYVALINLGHNVSAAVQQTWFTSMFKPAIRYSGAGFGYALAGAAGGFVPLIATALLGPDGNWVPVAAMLAAMCAVAGLTSLVSYSWTERGSHA
jgi:MHS family shikimate/dehydroshikimate transporter-like MFS transporter